MFPDGLSAPGANGAIFQKTFRRAARCMIILRGGIATVRWIGSIMHCTSNAARKRNEAEAIAVTKAVETTRQAMGTNERFTDTELALHQPGFRDSAPGRSADEWAAYYSERRQNDAMPDMMSAAEISRRPWMDSVSYAWRAPDPLELPPPGIVYDAIRNCFVDLEDSDDDDEEPARATGARTRARRMCHRPAAGSRCPLKTRPATSTVNSVLSHGKVIDVTASPCRRSTRRAAVHRCRVVTA
jgi:hypothetical protein